jgi:hypothetical protein
LIPFSVAGTVSRINVSEHWSTSVFWFVSIVAIIISNVTWRLYSSTKGESIQYFYQLSIILSIPLFSSVLCGLLVSRLRIKKSRLSARHIAFMFLIFASTASYFVNVKEHYRLGYEYREVDFADADILTGSDDYREILNWVRNNSNENDLLASNRYCESVEQRAPDCSGLWSLTSAITDRRMLIEGVYPPGGIDLSSEREFRRQIIESFVNTPSHVTLTQLEDYGVRWVVADYAVTNTRSWGEFAEVRFENKAGAILELVP